MESRVLGTLSPVAQALSSLPLGDAATRPREEPGVAASSVSSDQEKSLAWFYRKEK